MHLKELRDIYIGTFRHYKVIHCKMNRNRRLLINRIEKLGSIEHDEIFKIIKKSDVGYTQNSNGVFLNFSSLQDNIIQEIDTFVTYCEQNQKELDDYDKKINNVKLNNINNVTLSSGDNLENVLNDKQELDDKHWKTEVENNEKVKIFVNMLETNLEKIHKKNNNAKFVNAKKRLSKRLIPDKKTSNDYGNVLYKDKTELINRVVTQV